jgi:hypothetical protein
LKDWDILVAKRVDKHCGIDDSIVALRIVFSFCISSKSSWAAF